MKPSSNKLCLAGWILFGVGLLIVLTSAIYVSVAPRVYLARSRANIEPYSWDLLLELSQPAFHDTLFGSDPSIRLVPIRGTSLIEVSAEAHTPQAAAERANRVIIKVMETVTRRPGLTAEIFDRAEPPLKSHKPNGQVIMAVGGTVGATFGLGAVVLFVIEFSSRRRARCRQYACA